MSVVAVVPLRDGRSGKSRLASRLQAEDRSRLVGVLAHHVVTTLLDTDGVSRVLVVTHDVTFATIALTGVVTSTRLEVVRQPPTRPGLNAAAAFGRELVRAAPGSPAGVLVVHADLPALTRSDVGALLEAPADVALGPDRLGTGTNAVRLGAHLPFRFRFGQDSLVEHRREAARHGALVTLVDRPGIAVDLDTADDWDAYPGDVRDRLVAAAPAVATLGRAQRTS